MLAHHVAGVQHLGDLLGGVGDVVERHAVVAVHGDPQDPALPGRGQLHGLDIEVERAQGPFELTLDLLPDGVWLPGHRGGPPVLLWVPVSEVRRSRPLTEDTATIAAPTTRIWSRCARPPRRRRPAAGALGGVSRPGHAHGLRRRRPATPRGRDDTRAVAHTRSDGDTRAGRRRRAGRARGGRDHGCGRRGRCGPELSAAAGADEVPQCHAPRPPRRPRDDRRHHPLRDAGAGRRRPGARAGAPRRAATAADPRGRRRGGPERRPGPAARLDVGLGRPARPRAPASAQATPTGGGPR